MSRLLRSSAGFIVLQFRCSHAACRHVHASSFHHSTCGLGSFARRTAPTPPRLACVLPCSNSAWRAAAGMAQAGPLDIVGFWQLFEVAGAPDEADEVQGKYGAELGVGSEWEARAAAGQLQPFSLRVKPRGQGSGHTLDGPRPSAPPAPLTIHFKPSGTDEPLRGDAPTIGIPSFVELGSGSNVLASARAASAHAGASSQLQQYYFGVVAPPQWKEAAVGSPRSILPPSAREGAGQAALSEHSSPPDSGGSGATSSLDSSLASSLFSSLPSFTQMRPQVGGWVGGMAGGWVGGWVQTRPNTPFNSSGWVGFLGGQHL
jgi:hypothetical protein